MFSIQWTECSLKTHKGVWGARVIKFTYKWEVWCVGSSVYQFRFSVNGILILKWKGISFGPDLASIQGRHNWLKKKKEKDVFARLGKFCKEREAQYEMADVGKIKETCQAWPSSEDRLRVHPASAAGSQLSPSSHLKRVPAGGGFPLGDPSPSSQSETRMPARFHTVGRVESVSAKY